MKNAIAIAMIFTVLGVSAQQKLTATSARNYDETGTVQYMDSNEYIYNTWDGSLFSNEPEFKFEGSVFDWQFEQQLPSSNVQNDYSGITQPLILDATWNNSIVAGKVTVSESASDRREYVYDLAGNTTSVKYYYFDGISFILNSEETYAYDAFNNLSVSQGIYYGSGSPVVESIDSMFYTANQLVRHISYSWDGSSAYYANSESTISYSGTQVANIQLKSGDDITPLTLAYDIDYVYVAGKPDKLNGHEVFGGVPETTPSIVFQYTYGSNGKIAMSEVTIGGNPVQQMDFSYNAQGFITEMNSSTMNSSQTGLYVYNSRRMYYQSTVGLDEAIFAEAIIFPNPSNDFVTIQTADAIELVTVYALNGNIMMTQNSGDLNISNLPAGTYIANVKTSTGVAQARFVKQ